VFFVTISRSHRKKATLIHTFLSHHRSSSASDLLILNLPGEKFATLSTLTVYRWFLDIVVVWISRKLMCGAWTEKVYGIPNAQVGLARKRIMTTRPPLPPFSRCSESALGGRRLEFSRSNARTPIQADPHLGCRCEEKLFRPTRCELESNSFLTAVPHTFDRQESFSRQS